jgi:hypothetical protein
MHQNKSQAVTLFGKRVVISGNEIVQLISKFGRSQYVGVRFESTRSRSHSFELRKKKNCNRLRFQGISISEGSSILSAKNQSSSRL